MVAGRRSWFLHAFSIPYINASWVVMEVATIAVAGALLWVVRFPFITAPAAYALWYLSMDGTALIFGDTLDVAESAGFRCGSVLPC